MLESSKLQLQDLDISFNKTLFLYQKSFIRSTQKYYLSTSYQMVKLFGMLKTMLRPVIFVLAAAAATNWSWSGALLRFEPVTFKIEWCNYCGWTKKYYTLSVSKTTTKIVFAVFLYFQYLFIFYANRKVAKKLFTNSVITNKILSNFQS